MQVGEGTDETGHVGIAKSRFPQAEPHRPAWAKEVWESQVFAMFVRAQRGLP